MKLKIFFCSLLLLAPSFNAVAQTTVSYQYDNLNRLTQVTYSDGTVVNYTYDALGNRTSKTVTVPSSPTCVVTLAASPAAGGTVTGGGSYNVGQTATVTATPNSGYTFTNWAEGTTVISSLTTYSFTATGDRTLTAYFSSIAPDPQLPTVVTSDVIQLTNSTASCGGNVTSDGGASVTARGVCWSTTHNPTISNNHTNDGTGTGTFQSTITGLSENSTYYIRAFATNGQGTAYGAERTLFVESTPIPVIVLEQLNFDLCYNSSPVVLNDYAYISTDTNATITFTGNGVVDNVFYPTMVAIGTYAIVASYCDPVTGICATPVTITISVHPPITLTVDYPAIDTVYFSQLPLHLTGGHPEGGWFSGLYVNTEDSLFDPPRVIGYYQIFYEYVSEYGCYSNRTFNVRVLPDPVAVEVVETPEVTILPNPTTGKAIVLWGDLKVEKVDLIDATGKVVMTCNNMSEDQVVMDMGSLASSSYFVRIYWKGSEYYSTYKLIKQ